LKETTPEAAAWAAAGAASVGTGPALPAAPVRRPPSRVVYLKERNLNMMKNDLILRNPLRAMGFESEDILPAGGFGAVLARAGVGKTAFLVQLAINALLRGKNVLHISLSDPVRKVSLWYEEVFSVLSRQYGVAQSDHLWESLLPHRFIMTFKAERFSVATLEERMTDLMEQAIFMPQVVIIDGFDMAPSSFNALTDLKSLADTHAMRVWFTVRTHRHPESGAVSSQLPVDSIRHLFNVMIQLLPEGKLIHVRSLDSEGDAPLTTPLVLDPATMMIVEPQPAE
jgi:hypothetical protein